MISADIRLAQEMYTNITGSGIVAFINLRESLLQTGIKDKKIGIEFANQNRSKGNKETKSNYGGRAEHYFKVISERGIV